MDNKDSMTDGSLKKAYYFLFKKKFRRLAAANQISREQKNRISKAKNDWNELPENQNSRTRRRGNSGTGQNNAERRD